MQRPEEMKKGKRKARVPFHAGWLECLGISSSLAGRGSAGGGSRAQGLSEPYKPAELEPREAHAVTAASLVASQVAGGIQPSHLVQLLNQPVALGKEPREPEPGARRV